MKIAYTVCVLFLSWFCGLSQGQSAAPTNALPDDALDQNYVLHFQMIKAGTNAVDLKLMTARRGFQVSLDKPGLNFSGRLFLQPADEAYLEYEFMTVNPPPEPERKGGKSQANNQMFASLLYMAT